MTAEHADRQRHAALPDPPSGPWRQHKLDTLAALRHAALHLALEHGVEAITVADIAIAAGVSRRTFFNYFATKEDALVGETPQLSAYLREAIAARPAAETPLAAVHTALRQTYSVFVTDDGRERIRLRYQLLASHPQLVPHHLARYVAFEHLLTEALTARDTTHETSTDLGLLAALAASTTRLCTQRWAEHGNPSLATRLDTAFTTLQHGIP